MAEDRPPRRGTRGSCARGRRPRRAAELTTGGSLFRVYRGVILSRQRILAVNTVGAGPEARCEITLDETVVLTSPTPRRAFQGWRYLVGHEAPRDLADGSGRRRHPAGTLATAA